MIWHDEGRSEAGTNGFEPSDLKICDLCGALNLAQNTECFVCRWHGRFERRQEIVKLALEVVERKYGRVDEALLSDSCSSSFDPERDDRHLTGRLSGVFDRIRRWFNPE